MSETDWVIRVNDDLKRLLETFPSEENRWERRSIYRLPASITNLKILNRKAYVPQVVSFGPYHYGNENLKPMEEHKYRALMHFLSRSGQPIMHYFHVLCGVEQYLMDAYHPLDNHWRMETQEFLQLMILDGCFMLEILRIFTRDMEGYAENDPIFSNHGIVYVMPDIMRDMLMIENQLPLSVLHRLVQVEKNYSEAEAEEYMNGLLVHLYSLYSYTYDRSIRESLHVLDVCHRALLLPSDTSRRTWKRRWPNWVLEKTIPSAMELHEAGIQIQRSRSRSLQDIRFYKGDFCVILTLPAIVVDNTTETLFLNLLAFERLHVGAGREVTNYLAFMNNIIRDSKDISLLRSCGIVQNSLGKDEAVADLFNSLTRDIAIDPASSVYVVDKEVIKYCNRPWVRWRANLVRTYFSNPWASISVIASMFLFAFTLAQTSYTVIAYYRRP